MGFRIISTSCLLIFLSSQAYIYEVTVMRKGDKTFIGCSDFHDKLHPASSSQREQIEKIIASCNKNRTKIIVEDLSSPNDFGRKACGPFAINSNQGILAGLGKYCSHQGIAMENVEYRYCRVAALGPVVNNITANPQIFSSTNSLTVQSVVNEITQASNEINVARYPALKSFYLQEMRAIRSSLDRLKLARTGSKSVSDYVSSNSSIQNRLGMVKELLTFDSALVDLKMVQALVHNQSPITIAFAGGSHITRVNSMLEKMGYKQIAQTKTTYHKESDPQVAIGSPIGQVGTSLKPVPVPLTLLERFMK